MAGAGKDDRRADGWREAVKGSILVLAIILLTLLMATIARGAEPCQRWHEVVDGHDVQTNEPVQCDGALGPREQFAKLLKCDMSELPACQTKLSAEQERSGKVETALRKKIDIEAKRADSHAEENARLRGKLESVATVEWYEHPALWAAVGAAAVGVVWLVVEVTR
jgi:hypothetical protein